MSSMAGPQKRDPPERAYRARDLLHRPVEGVDIYSAKLELGVYCG